MASEVEYIGPTMAPSVPMHDGGETVIGPEGAEFREWIIAQAGEVDSSPSHPLVKGVPPRGAGGPAGRGQQAGTASRHPQAPTRPPTSGQVAGIS